MEQLASWRARRDFCPSRPRRPSEVNNRIELENVSKHYGSTRALVEISMAIPSGKIRGLVGENGAGKSTLAKIIAGDIRPTSGTVKLNGVNVP
jgi:ABC-type multidrug transport system ATPase subunit